MLAHLNIKNFAVVQSLDIELTGGLSTITGETGAGKSIMVDAMGLVLGDRADSGVIRAGTDRAEITATFDLGEDSFASRWLADQEFDSDACILRRVLGRDGRSRAFINGVPVTLQQLKSLGESLIDIHSQHEHQSLLKKSAHITLLDNFAQCKALAEAVVRSFRSWHEAQQKLDALIQQTTAQQEHLELLAYQLDELCDLDLKDGELAQLEQEQKRLSEAESILENGGKVIELLDAGSSDSADMNCLSQLASARRLIEDIQDENEHLLNATTLLEEARIQLEESASSLQQYLDKIEINPQRLEQTEQRMSDIFELSRKHKLQPGELLAQRERLTGELAQLQSAEAGIEELQQAAGQAREQFFELARELSDKRANAVKMLGEDVTSHLHDMGMQGSRFCVQLEPLDNDSASAHGLEDVEFLVSTNAGQEPRPLNKIASGGELSRISLAIQVVSARDTQIPTLVFDEVDVGIGGATAETVGMLLRKLGAAGQVICVTHQPQVAAKGHSHLSVMKQTVNDSADSKFEYLTGEAKVSEIARMLGGIKLTDQTLAHAQEMLAATTDV